MGFESSNERPPKTEQQVAEQISRIAHILEERAGTDLITVPEVTLYDPSHPDYMVNNHPEWAGGNTQLVERTGEVGGNEKIIQIEADPKKGKVWGELVRIEDGKRKVTRLNQKQKISASAKILSKALEKVAREEQEVEEFINS
ncbi:hypothetical protein BH23PAT1_BH23PAT1_3030 [soil metagenome]